MDHVHAWKDPVDKDGRALWPGILLARFLLRRLLNTGVSVFYEWIPRALNRVADRISHQALRERSVRGWQPPDVWPEELPISYQTVFLRIGLNRQTTAAFCEYHLDPAARIV